MPARICVENGCGKFAIGVGYWRPAAGDNPAGPPRPWRCREHYLAAVQGEFVRFEVTGPALIVDARTGESVAAPGVVELDPIATNIDLLVASGLGRRVLVQPVKGEPAKAPAGSKG